MTTRKHHNTERIFVTSPGFDIAATSRMATYFNAILVRVRPEDFLKSLLLEKMKKTGCQ